MKEYDIDVSELEHQRYEEIKKSKSYLEFNVLIPCEKNGPKGHKIPVIATHAENAGPQEIADLYAILCQMKEFYEKEYPLECLLAKLATRCTEIGHYDNLSKNEEDESANE